MVYPKGLIVYATHAKSLYLRKTKHHRCMKRVLVALHAMIIFLRIGLLDHGKGRSRFCCPKNVGKSILDGDTIDLL
jgi:hypothetical protein